MTELQDYNQLLKLACDYLKCSFLYTTYYMMKRDITKYIDVIGIAAYNDKIMKDKDGRYLCLPNLI